MKTITYFKIFFLLVFALIGSRAIEAQEIKPEPPPPTDQRPGADQPRDGRGHMLRQLGLLEEQVQQIQKINSVKRPLMAEAHKRLREANRALDLAIYADQVSEGDVQARLQELQLAQGELAKLRYMNELAVRRVLTQEQLIRFRELREKFETMRRGMDKLRRQRIEKRLDGQGQPVPRRNVRPVQEKPIL